MNEEINKNTITYEDGWQEVSSTEYPQSSEIEVDEATSEEPVIKKEKNKSYGQLLVTVQLVICILIAIAALLLKTVGGDIYKYASEWYYSELNKSIIADSNGENFSLEKFFPVATNDEA